MHDTFRAAAIPVGAVLMLATALARLGRLRLRDAAVGRGLHRGACGRAACRRPCPAPSRQLEPGAVLRGAAGHRRAAERADRLRLRLGHPGVPRHPDPHAAFGRNLPHGRRHEQPDPARGPALRVPRPAHRNDRHGARHGDLPGGAAGPCARRPVIRAARRDVSDLRHLRLESRRHGGNRAGAVPRDEAPRRSRRGARLAARRVRRDERDHPALVGADHHRLGHGCIDRRTVHRRAAAGRGAGNRAGGDRAMAEQGRGPGRRQAGAAERDRSHVRSSAPRADPAVRDPHGGGEGGGDRHRGLHDRDRVRVRGGAGVLPRSSIGGGSIRCWWKPHRCRGPSC